MSKDRSGKRNYLSIAPPFGFRNGLRQQGMSLEFALFVTAPFDYAQDRKAVTYKTNPCIGCGICVTACTELVERACLFTPSPQASAWGVKRIPCGGNASAPCALSSKIG